jgi:CRP-like cAMP-binding protein
MAGLEAVPIFQKLDAAEMASLLKIAHKETFASDKVIFFEGDRSEALYVILAGSVKVFRTSEDGKEKVVNTLGPGSFFGEFAMLDGAPRSASVAALEETTMLAIEHRDFRGFVKTAPEVMWKVLEAMCVRMRRYDDLLAAQQRDVPYRLLRSLVDLMKKHGEQRLDGVRIGVKLTIETLSGMISGPPDRVARLLTRYEEDKLLRREGEYLLVVDPYALERALEFEKDWE